MKINKKLIKFNTSSRKGMRIKYIVIHDTGNKSKGADAEAHYKYFNGGNRNASAHYFVDETQVLQLVEDDTSAWAVGDGKNKYGVTNANSLSIEICVNSDGNYGVAVQKTIELTKHLMNKHNIPIENVIRHYDASRKNCPASMAKDNWKAWGEFKEALKDDKPLVKIKIKGKLYNMEGIFQNDKNYVGVREFAEALGYTVDWDSANKAVLIK